MNKLKVDHVVEASVLTPEHQLLWDAAAYIEKHGWCQDSVSTADGRVCLVGAIKAAAGMPIHGHDWSSGPGAVAYAACEIMDNRTSRPAADWNDRDGRTQDEVVSAMRAAALS